MTKVVRPRKWAVSKIRAWCIVFEALPSLNAGLQTHCGLFKSQFANLCQDSGFDPDLNLENE
jgi:hypothetical protein